MIERTQKGMSTLMARVYTQLTSGDPKSILEARNQIAVHKGAALAWLALDLTDRVKLWINQPGANPDTKNRQYFEDLLVDALSTGNGAGSDWSTLGRAARALFYVGRFRKSLRWFNDALNAIKAPIGIPSLSPSEQRDAWDIWAARAEVRIYLGHPDEAVAELRQIANPVGWHKWIEAFALHQLAFFERPDNGFGGYPTDQLQSDAAGLEDRYVESNALIDAILRGGDLVGDEPFDIQLLKAANWGAIARRRSLPAPHGGGDANAADTAAGEALSLFGQAPSDDSSNSDWSWAKEARGRLPKFYRPALDKFYSNNRQAVMDWREAYRDHYKKNLRRAGLDLAKSSGPGMDGWVDTNDDHSDDT